MLTRVLPPEDEEVSDIDKKKQDIDEAKVAKYEKKDDDKDEDSNVIYDRFNRIIGRSK